MRADVTLVLAAAVRLAVPLLFAALGELIAQRVGTVNISVEGMMLGGAFAAAVAAAASGSVALGLAAALAAGALLGLVQAAMSYRLTANVYVVGLTINILVLGVTSFLAAQLDLGVPARAQVVRVPLLVDLPVAGPALFALRWPAYLLYALVPLAGWALYRSRAGLELRSVGEAPRAADAAGVPVNRRRGQAVMLCGACAGFGGASLALAEVGRFSANMTAGRGFIAIAAVVFGGWTVRGTAAGCLVFGAADALRLALPALGVVLPPQLLVAAPYLLAILATLLIAPRSRAPAALGVPFSRGAT